MRVSNYRRSGLIGQYRYDMHRNPAKHIALGPLVYFLLCHFNTIINWGSPLMAMSRISVTINATQRDDVRLPSQGHDGAISRDKQGVLRAIIDKEFADIRFSCVGEEDRHRGFNCQEIE